MAVEWVDVSDIHLRDIRFQVTREDGRVFDFSDVVSSLQWSDHANNAGAEVGINCVGKVADILKIGGEGSSCRITAPLVNLESGTLERRELWQGTFEEVVDYRSEGEIDRTIIGYDIARALSVDEEDYVWINLSLSTILFRVTSDFGLPLAPSVPIIHQPKLGQIVMRGRTLWQALQEAQQRHFDLTGEAYRIYAADGRIHLRKQGDQERWWVFEAGESVSAVRRSRSLQEMVNQIKIYGVFEGETTKPKVEAIKKNTESQALYGLRQRVEYLSSAEDEAKVITLAQKNIDRNSTPNEVIEITGWLVPNLRAGERIRYVDEEWGLDRLYYVESIETMWSTEKAETAATVRREQIDTGQLLEEITKV